MPKKKRAKSNGEGETDEKRSAAGGNGCRCKDVAQKKPGELAKIMLRDLAFWKKKEQ